MIDMAVSMFRALMCDRDIEVDDATLAKWCEDWQRDEPASMYEFLRARVDALRWKSEEGR